VIFSEYLKSTYTFERINDINDINDVCDICGYLKDGKLEIFILLFSHDYNDWKHVRKQVHNSGQDRGKYGGRGQLDLPSQPSLQGQLDQQDHREHRDLRTEWTSLGYFHLQVHNHGSSYLYKVIALTSGHDISKRGHTENEETINAICLLPRQLYLYCSYFLLYLNTILILSSFLSPILTEAWKVKLGLPVVFCHCSSFLRKLVFCLRYVVINLKTSLNGADTLNLSLITLFSVHLSLVIPLCQVST
jgi:hypothetical protein